MHRLRSSWTDDARLLFRPAETYRELVGSVGRNPAVARPLLLLFVMGCTVSLAASGRLSVRLVIDGMLSFAFLPVFAVTAFAIVYRTRTERPLTVGRAVDLFFTGQLHWILWLIGLAGVCTLVPPRRLGPWFLPLQLSLTIPVAWSAVIDFHFFREVAGRAARAAVRDLLLCRAIAWTAATAYFLGIAIWSEVVPAAIGWMFR